MKKSLLLSLAAVAAMSASAEKIVWDFDTHGFFKEYTVGDGIDLIDKYGVDIDKHSLMDATKDETNTEEPYWNQHGIPNRVVSLYDGKTYALTADPEWKAGTLADPYKFIPGDEIEPGVFTDDVLESLGAEYAKQLLGNPYIGWMERTPENQYWGPARMRYYPLYGSDDAFVDKDFNAVDEATWIANKGALAWIKSGQGKKPIAGTYVQFPEVQGPFTVTYYIASTEANFKYSMIPVVNGAVVEDKVESVVEDITMKRYYKKTYTYSGTDKAALRIMSDGCGVVLYYVEFANGADSALEDVIAPAEDENAPIYNTLGQRVSKDYKGLVIKNGVKYIQK